MASVGKHIRQLRTAKHMTQEELAEKLFVTRQAVSAWETGKAQPDVEMLERIAAALGTDVTVVIYGTRPTSLLQVALRKKWWQGFVWGILITRLIYILLYQGYWDTWTKGLNYQFGDPNYQVYIAELPGSYTLELDLTDPDSNVGKVLYEDDTGCRIEVSNIAWNVDDDRAWNIWFTAEGICRQRGGRIISAMMTESDNLFDSRVSISETANMTVSTEGDSHLAMPTGDTFLMKNHKNFGYTLFYGSGNPAELPESVTITLENLMEFTTVRIVDRFTAPVNEISTGKQAFILEK